jgi:hypothetical protein
VRVRLLHQFLPFGGRTVDEGVHEECGTPRLVAEEPKGDGQGLVRLLG